MSDTPETLSSILAYFRQFALRAAEWDKMISPESILLLADKVEAAAERERAEFRRQLRNEIQINDALATVRPQLHSVGDVITEAAKERAHEIELAKLRAPGNAAALREALVAFVDSIQWLCDGDERGIFKKQFAPLLSEARAALAAPARNCDRPFRSVDEALGAYVTERGDGPHLGYCDAIKWALAPAQEGGDHA